MFRTKDNYGRHRYSERSKAKVLDNRDPANKGRILIDHPILGETVWVPYLHSPGQFDVPSIGDIVYVECDSGEPEFPIAHGNLTIGYPGKANIPIAFSDRNVPTNRGLYTPSGHLIELDDGISNPTNSPKDTDLTTLRRGIRITTAPHDESDTKSYKIHIMDDPDHGLEKILIESRDGSSITIDSSSGQITINAKQTVNVTAGADCNVVCSGNAKISAQQITLNGSSGNVLTTTTDPVIDSIFGYPTTGVTTVKSG
jgi:phage baseplate assembly protein gpV